MSTDYREKRIVCAAAKVDTARARDLDAQRPAVRACESNNSPDICDTVVWKDSGGDLWSFHPRSGSLWNLMREGLSATLEPGIFTVGRKHAQPVCAVELDSVRKLNGLSLDSSLISGRIASALRHLSSSQFRIFRPASQRRPGHDFQQTQTAGTAASTETTAFQPMLWSMYQDVSKSFWKQAALALRRSAGKIRLLGMGWQNGANASLEFDAVAAKEMNGSETVVDVTTDGLVTEQMEDSSIEEVYVGKPLMTLRRHQPEAAAATVSSRESSPALSDHLAHSLRRQIETLDSNEDEIEIENGSFIQEDDMTDVPLANDNEDAAFLDFINQSKIAVGRQELSNQVAGELGRGYGLKSARQEKCGNDF
ncbi:hypothetical protein CcCBS67573_g07124 [Chytriomyces confervae]|uniref:Uncharacterized protein n=1 Tax=Chytriomyces confervae TaxID=246404 RepID=A0A507EYZ2_9FUNG|nr:hypothetical protein CcCBS67573_g07124 [Chytriomyces confervae]